MFTLALCFVFSIVEAQIIVPVSEFEKTSIEVNGSEGTCFVNFKTYGAPNYHLLLAMKDMIFHQLNQQGVTWISVTDVVLGDYHDFLDYYPGVIEFHVLKNDTGKERQLLLRNSSNANNVSMSITQAVSDDEIRIYSISSDCVPFKAFPGRKTLVTLSGSQVGVSYVIDNDTIQGTGHPLVFEKVFTKGSYMMKAQKDGVIKIMDGRIDISYYQFLEAGLCREQEEMIGTPAQIDNVRPGCGFAAFQIAFIDLMSVYQKRQLDEMFDEINNGKSTCDPGFRIEREGNMVYLSTGPNISGNVLISDVFLSLDNGTGGKQYFIRVIVDEQFYCPIRHYRLIEPTNYDSDNYSLKLSGTQLNVKYKLFKDSVFMQEQVGSIKNLIEFSNLSGRGTYYVEAHYCDTIVPMDGVLYVDGGAGIASYVKENVYTREDKSVAMYIYYDGLGREMQCHVKNAGCDGQDVIVPRVYDNMGRESKSFLSYGIFSGGFRKNVVAEQDAFYQAHFGENHYAFSENIFDNSPRDLVVESSLPGYATRLGGGHTVKSVTRKNKSSDKVKHYMLSGTSLRLSGLYSTGMLMVAEVIDGDGEVSLEYTNMEGKVMCKSQAGVSTYYVYDNLGLLRYIVPPVQDSLFISGQKTLTELSKYCYYMEYDARGRIYKQYIPGAGYTLTLYDKRDRKVLEQDAKMRETNQWYFTKYDEFDRPVIGGICTGSEVTYAGQLASQVLFGEERGNVLHGYTNRCVPINVNAVDCLVVTYYDDYTWPEQSSVAFSVADSLGGVYTNRIRGQVTGTKTKVLGVSTAQWLLSGVYMDADYRVLQTVSQLYPAGIEVVSNRHDFVGNVVRVKVKQTIGGTVNEYVKDMDYDTHGRLLSTRMRITGDTSNGEVMLSSIEYDELGRLSTETLHNGQESIISVYDVRGRESGRFSSYFSHELGFEVVEGNLNSLVLPRYNGNVSYMKWGKGSVTDQGYTYLYNAQKQLTAATYLQKSGVTWSGTGKYAEREIRYDRNGNLKRMIRTNSSGGMLHDIEYQYSHVTNGNAISAVKMNGRTSATYLYDAIGNLTKDGRRGVTISYNELNLPFEISDGTSKISYIYSATGEKLAQKAGNSLTYYRGNVMVYDGNALSYILYPGGMARKVNNGYVYDYFLTDHVGSTRVVLESSGNRLSSIQSMDYYPFGLAFSLNNLDKNKYLFSGKELQDVMLGGEPLNLLDFGWRLYDPIVARWFCQDPVMQLVSPYGFCGNNPILCVDQNGEFFWVLIPVAIGAVVNVIQNWEHISAGKGWSAVGRFFSFAALGAGNGALSFYFPGWGSAVGEGLQEMGNSLIRSDGKNFMELLESGTIRAVTSFLGGSVGKIAGNLAGKGLNRLGVSNIWTEKITTNVVKSEVSGIVNTTFNTAYYEQSFKAGWQEATSARNIFTNGLTGLGYGLAESGMQRRQQMSRISTIRRMDLPDDGVSPASNEINLNTNKVLEIPEVVPKSQRIFMSPISEIPTYRWINHSSIKIRMPDGREFKVRIHK